MTVSDLSQLLIDMLLTQCYTALALELQDPAKQCHTFMLCSQNSEYHALERVYWSGAVLQESYSNAKRF